MAQALDIIENVEIDGTSYSADFVGSEDGPQIEAIHKRYDYTDGRTGWTTMHPECLPDTHVDALWAAYDTENARGGV